MTTWEYIAIANPRGASQMLSSHGIQPIRDQRALASQLAELVRSNRQNAEILDELTAIHPDLDLFKRQMEDYRSRMKEQFSNMNGDVLKSEVQNLKDQVNNKQEGSGNSQQNILLTGGIILIGLALVLKR